ncbi:MAG: class I SAM-dependent methyltransferase [Thermomicrobiales bacterium]
MTEREFTVTWFNRNIPHLSQVLEPLAGQPALQMLEIGAYEGASTCWFLDNLLTGDGSHLTSLDTWEGSGENDPTRMPEVWRRFQRNTAAYVTARRLTVVVGTSQRWLAAQVAALRPGAPPFDMIHIDGSHAAADVLSDGVLSWALLRKQGVIIFDDYFWEGGRSEQERPRFAIDSFLACFLGQYDEVYRGHQVILRKR